MSQVKLKALRSFSSTVWGNVEEGATFEVAPGYVAMLVKEGYAEEIGKAKAAPAPVEPPPPPTKKAPKIDKFVKEGGNPHEYPPEGFLANSTAEEIATACAAYDLEQAAKNAQ